MLDFITLAVQPFVKIRKEEWPKALLMFFYFFITITCLYILKPVRSSIFLEKSGFENLPYVWISTVLVLMGIVAVYVKFASWVEKNVLLIGTVLFFVSNIFTFWWLLGRDIPNLPAVFYIWVSIFSIMTVTQFWTLANDIFNPREAKRLFGFIGSGGILGGMTGGYITGLLVHGVGTINLLIVAAVILGFSVVVIQVIWRGEHTRRETKLYHDPKFEEHISKEEKTKQSSDLFRNIWRSKYLLLLLTMVCLAKLVSTLVEYQFSGIVQNSFLGIDKKTAFFGWFWGMLNTVSFIIQFFLTSRVLRHLGIKVALLILPIGLLFGNMAILLNPSLWSAVFTMMYDGSLNYSLNQASKEVLYLPILREIRYRVKPFIDMVGYRTAKGVGSLLILFMTQVLVFDHQYLPLVTLALIAVWITAAFVMKKEYMGELRNFLAKERGQAQAITIQSSEIYQVHALIDTFSHKEPKNRYFALRALNLAQNSELNSVLANFHKQDLESAREEIRGYFHEEPTSSPELFEQKCLEELKAVMMRSGLENFQETLRFTSSFRGGEEIALIRNFLVGRSEEIRKAAFLLGVLFDGEFDSTRLPEDLKQSFRLDGSVRRLSLDGYDFHLKTLELNEKASEIRRKLIEFLKMPDAEKTFGLIEDFLRDEEDFMTVMDWLLNRERLPEFAFIHLTRILSMIPRPKSIEILERALSITEGNRRNAVIEAMSKIRLENPGLDFNEDVLSREINVEVREYGTALRLLSIYLWRGNKNFNQASSLGDAFVKAQESRLQEIVQRLFLLLLLLSEPEDVRAAYSGFSHTSDYVRANALELLDNLLVPRLKRPILALLDGEDSLPRIRERGIKDFHWNEERADSYLKKTVASGEPWSSLSSIILMARCQLRGVLEECFTQGEFPNPLVRDTFLLTQASLREKA